MARLGIIATILLVAGSSYADDCCVGRVGDANGLGVYPDEISLGDIMMMIDAKFISESCDRIPCLAEADVKQDGGAEPTCEDITLGDIMVLVDFLFITGPQNATLPECLSSTVTDCDGNVYQTVTIGTQVWMAENLKVTHYCNGEAIPNVTDNAAWEALTTGAYCEYNNDTNNVATYGRLYNGYAVADGRQIAPAGWHVASDAEWKQLEMYLGMSQAEADAEGTARGTTEGGKLKETGTTHWVSPNTGATNETGFSGLPSGYRIYFGPYYDIGDYGYFWSSTELNSNYNYAWYRRLYHDGSVVGRYYYNKQVGFPVRCVKDAEESTLTDIDGNVYQTVAIGTQVWMAENLKVTHYPNGDDIPNVTDNATWEALNTGAYCEYNNDTNNVATYGRLYSGYAVGDSRNIAPTGWHIPSDAEWQTLVDYLGGISVAGGKMKEAGTMHWYSPNIGATNESGFSGLPCGYRSYDGPYSRIGYSAYFWSSTELSSSEAWYRYLDYNGSGVYRGSSGKRFGYSVRCVRD